MSTIADAMSQLYAIEAALTITSPIPTGIKKVWPSLPGQDDKIKDVDTPCFVNTFSPDLIQFDSALLRTGWAIHARLVVYDGQMDRQIAIAQAFVEPVIDAFCANIKLGLSAWTVLRLRFNEEQPRQFPELSDAAGLRLLGLDFFIDVVHNAPKTYQAGDPP